MIALNTEAHVNQGRWLAVCPVCSVGLHLARGPRTVGRRFVYQGGPCFGCQYPLTVGWPDHADLIDETLRRRLPINRNWSPNETIEQLEAENGVWL